MTNIAQPIDTRTIFNPIQPIGKVGPEQRIDDRALNGEWDQRKGVGSVVEASPTAKSFSEAIGEKAIEATHKLEGIKLNPSPADAQKLRETDTLEKLRNLAETLEPTSERTPRHIPTQIREAKEAADSAHRLLQGSLAAQPEQSRLVQRVREANEAANATQEFINVAIRMAEAAGTEVGRYADKISMRLDRIQMLNNLETLMNKHKGEESVDLLSPKEGQELDFAKIERLRKTLVEEHGVPLNWTDSKWDKGSFEGLLKGIDLARQAEFASNQKDNIFLQKLTTAEQHFWLMVTNTISRLSDILREISRNMSK
ncbi:MAG: hypothetical protein AB7F31_00960 [Parachlamydiales bacterium]